MQRLTYRSPAADAVERLTTAGFLRFSSEQGSWQDANEHLLHAWVRDAKERAVVMGILGDPDANGHERLRRDALDQWRERIAPGTWVLGRLAQAPRGTRHIVRIGVGYGFGLGDHPTTRCAATLLARRGCARERVLDLGSGTGVLAALAGLLGARTIDAVDLDRDSVQHTRSTLRLNDVQGRVWRSNLLRQVSGKYDLIAANLVSDLLVELFASRTLGRALKPGGAVLCSGIRADKRPWVESAARDDGWRVTARTRHQGWVGIALARS